ncbi:MAG TPA: nicotinate-nicotinamide nucleotide adenylyltransferase [Candidatus Saccharimonadia bacterium]|nr:nicotinate-nicotinamide nucleotide adenylyltransferase [Candidatus Saccharimonadia bacterium]
MARIGIYAGTFDPVHSGHMAFALQSLKAANLDRICFLPERRPRQKHQVEHFGHRVAMLNRAAKPYPEFTVLELVDVSFNVDRTLPFLQRMFPGDELVFLFGSDIVPGLAQWPHVEKLLQASELVIGLRFKDDRAKIHEIVESWQTQPKAVTIFESFAPEVSSGKVRQALRERQYAKGVLKSVERYSDHNWLYVSLAN